jgi:outer membrane lipoprotein LolB
MKKVPFIAALIALLTLLLSGCALPAPPPEFSANGDWVRRGRLAVRIDSESPQFFSAGFELTGNSSTGELSLFTPLGNTAAVISWSPTTTQLQSKGETLRFETLNALMKQMLGTELPVTALFGWLTGENLAVPDWDVDLSQQIAGRIVARRMHPAPPAEFRIIVEQPHIPAP